MSSTNQGNQQSGTKEYTGFEKDHGDTKQQQAGQSAQSGMASGAVSVDHTKSGGSSGNLDGTEVESRHLHK